ncbi:MAG: DEAD/DEAH box helicase [Kiritimatiellaeota bacterium]|nr:DEAD/DEAH box helicase [Kiritimatiellota bacterium]
MSLELILLPNFHLAVDETKSAVPLNKARIELDERLDKAFSRSPYEALFHLAFVKEEVRLSANLAFWKNFSGYFVETLRLTPSVEALRHKQVIHPDVFFFEELSSNAPFFQGSEYLSPECLEFHWKGLNGYFQKEIEKYKGSVESFFRRYSPDIHLVGRIFFHLVESKDAKAPFAFMSTYSVGLNKKKESKHRPLQYALTEFAADQDKLLELLSTVSTAAEKSQFMKELMDSGELFYPLNLTADESFNFLKEIPLYEAAGILCRIPNWWRVGKKGASLAVSFGEKKKESLLGMKSLVDFNAKIMLGELELSPEEAERILKESEGLVQLKGKWVVVDREKLEDSLNKWKIANELMLKEDLALGDAMRMLMMKNGDTALSGIIDDDDVDVGVGEWLRDVMEKMRNPRGLTPAKTTKDFKATLRPYQREGVSWLSHLDSFALGACLADDMGLGKTVQVIALLNALRKKNGSVASLLVLPASLIHNWASELAKFAPEIRFAIAHPSAGDDALGKKLDPKKLKSVDVVLTTYGLMRRYEWIAQFKWQYVILDEAQAIKNPNTAQTKSVKMLKSFNRIVLTGTPIENKLSDLWSLFDFLNPGLLGTRKEFTAFIKHNEDLSTLRKVISPFILRRLKTDKKIISDLPDKIELDSYANLTKHQCVLYQDLVENLKEALRDSEGGIQRKGLVLASLMKFKQICNHPDQYLGNSGTGGYSEKESGKFQRLREICETIREKREKVLIFTQFKEITAGLSDFLEKVFGHPGLVLHGSISIKKRKELVDRFQSDEYYPFFILSVKAGGTGLNLTAANHVIHFDRWWNPAVENQATDRAFRIGQRKSVVVHKFITEGTIEEKIAQMLQNKKKLSEEVLADSNEASFITEMNDDELINLFSLNSVSATGGEL